MVDRASKLTKLAKVSQKTAVEVKESLVQNLRPVKAHVLTLTADNGGVENCFLYSFSVARKAY